ncbi:response regulator transcription factor [Reyranella soli]|jgi:FixJ family two-component response regulator|uniref:DNA-binding response regulator n=1 Tax=Reyranella soli TaxID=1230389 RepID=A0A512NJA6_9HYPH|nr:response regulator transcription factor [Reyranella soli]GEP59030.1 DNA-binding response regulator [Reyranella soli]
MSRATTQVPSAPLPTVFVIDDDEDMRSALGNLFRSVGHEVKLFGSAAEFLQDTSSDAPGCLVLDVRLPGMSGLDFQNKLASTNAHIPIVFMTGHGDIPMSVRAMKAGAVDFLTKPFRDQDMLDAVTRAIEADRSRRSSQQASSGVRDSYGRLSPREREVMTLVTRGLMNKQVAHELGLSEITVKLYRGQAMRKMGAGSLADLVRMAELLGLHKSQ